jgi:hypothetical protein
VKGYTVTEVEGEGRYEQAVRQEDGQNTETLVASQVATNVEIRAVVTKELSNVVLYALKEQQQNFAIVAYRQTVEALAEL